MLTCTSYKWYIFPRHYWAHLANGSFWLFLFIFPVNTYLFSSCFHSEFANAWQWWCPLACLQPLEQHNFLRFLAVMDDDNEKTKINKIRLVGLTLEKKKNQWSDLFSFQHLKLGLLFGKPGYVVFSDRFTSFGGFQRETVHALWISSTDILNQHMSKQKHISS